MHGTAYANHAVDKCDLLIAIGARFDDRVTGKLAAFAQRAKVIHIDIDPAEIAKTVPVDLSIVGDCKRVLGLLLEKVQPREETDWNRQIMQWRNEFPLHCPVDDSQVLPQCVIQTLWNLTKGEAIIVTDVGQHQMFTALHYLGDQAEEISVERRHGHDGLRFPGGYRRGCGLSRCACVRDMR